MAINSPLNNETVTPSDEYQVSSKFCPGKSAKIPVNPSDFSKNNNCLDAVLILSLDIIFF